MEADDIRVTKIILDLYRAANHSGLMRFYAAHCSAIETSDDLYPILASAAYTDNCSSWLEIIEKLAKLPSCNRPKKVHPYGMLSFSSIRTTLNALSGLSQQDWAESVDLSDYLELLEKLKQLACSSPSLLARTLSLSACLPASFHYLCNMTLQELGEHITSGNYYYQRCAHLGSEWLSTGYIHTHPNPLVCTGYPEWLRNTFFSRSQPEEKICVVLDASEERHLVSIPAIMHHAGCNSIQDIAYLTSNPVNTRTFFTSTCRVGIFFAAYYPFRLIKFNLVASSIYNASVTSNDQAQPYIGKFLCFLGRLRSHRLALLCHLYKQGLYDHVTHSWWHSKGELSEQEIRTLCSSFIDPLDSQISSAIAHLSSLPRNVLKGGSQTSLLTAFTMPHEFMHQFQYHIVCETDYIAFQGVTEKSLKTSMLGLPAVFLAPPGTVGYLSSLGLDVFNDYIDHSYDDFHDPSNRMSLLVGEIKRLCATSTPSPSPSRLLAAKKTNSSVLIDYMKQCSRLPTAY